MPESRLRLRPLLLNVLLVGLALLLAAPPASAATKKDQRRAEVLAKKAERTLDKAPETASELVLEALLLHPLNVRARRVRVLTYSAYLAVAAPMVQEGTLPRSFVEELAMVLAREAWIVLQIAPGGNAAEESRAALGILGLDPDDPDPEILETVAIYRELDRLHSIPGKKLSKPERASMEAGMARVFLDVGLFDQAAPRLEKALQLDPSNREALEGQLSLLLQLAHSSEDQAEIEQLMQQAALAWEQLAKLYPDSWHVEVYRPYFAKEQVEPLFPEPAADCSAEAVSAYEEAERAFARRDAPAAIEAYERALTACPEHPRWWVHYGDAYFMQGRFHEALDTYQMALKLEPCDWVAHRFSADTLLSLELPEEAHRSLATSVACNPAYELGWRDLDGLLRSRGGTVRRYRLDEPLVNGDSLRAQEAAVKARLGGPDPMEGALWADLAAAQEAGLLTEALCIHLIDANTATACRELQKTSLGTLTRYVREFVAPLPEVAPAE
jgi:tetratricopeptide (TPR) repeat protein